MKKIAVGMAMAVALVVGAGVLAADRGDDVRAQIEAANDVFEAIFAKADAAGIAALYTDDGQILPPNAKATTGHKNIAAYWGGAMAGGAAGITLTTTEVEQHGDTVIEVGTGDILDSKKKVLDSAKYIVIWKRVGGKWKLHRDIWNSNLAAS